MRTAARRAVALGLAVAVSCAQAAPLSERSLPADLQSMGYKAQVERVGSRMQYNVITRYNGLSIPIGLSLSEGHINLWMLVRLWQLPKGRMLAPEAAQALLRLNEQLSLGGACYYGIAGDWVMLNCAYPNTSDAVAPFKSRIDTVDHTVYATQKIWSVTVPAPAARGR